MTTPAHTLDIARSQLGEGEHPDGSNCQPYSQYWHEPCEAWCADFASWVLKHADALDVPMSPAARILADGYKKAGRWHTDTPRPGDLAFYIWDGDTQIHHVELVEAVRSDSAPIPGGHAIVTVGGNVSNKVQRVVRRANVVGYGRPKYSSTPAPAPQPAKPGKKPTKPKKKTHPLLKRGDTGSSVAELQTALNKHGARLKVDGVFGKHTQAAVRNFQRAQRIEVDGIAGPQTWGRLDA